ncbi:MAG: MBL fold metallo-hydrolase [Deltaproteobacteria bacterium]
MQIHILASGSTGNAIYLSLGQTRILVDAGISARRIEQGLASIGVKAGDLDAVLITHEHSDHIKGLEVLTRKHELPVYTRERTWEAIPGKDKLAGRCWQAIDQDFSIGAVDIKAFGISHDAADPVGFCFYYQQYKWVIVTDLGTVTPGVEKALSGADLAVVESNHDPDLLKNGPYPAFLKQRIMSKQGHLSNFDTAALLSRIAPLKRMQVFLAHLSQQNNRPQLAEETVAEILARHGCRAGEDIVLHRTYPDAAAGISF